MKGVCAGLDCFVLARHGANWQKRGPMGKPARVKLTADEEKRVELSAPTSRPNKGLKVIPREHRARSSGEMIGNLGKG